jgi:hypothetical protein
MLHLYLKGEKEIKERLLKNISGHLDRCSMEAMWALARTANK